MVTWTKYYNIHSETNLDPTKQTLTRRNIMYQSKIWGMAPEITGVYEATREPPTFPASEPSLLSSLAGGAGGGGFPFPPRLEGSTRRAPSLRWEGSPAPFWVDATSAIGGREGGGRGVAGASRTVLPWLPPAAFVGLPRIWFLAS
jgi:hypothetical protein